MASWVDNMNGPAAPPEPAEDQPLGVDWLSRNYPEAARPTDDAETISASIAPPQTASWLTRTDTVNTDAAFSPPAPARVPLQTPDLDDPVAAAADAAFAEAATQAALNQELRALREPAAPGQREPDQWSPATEQTGEVIHALLGMPDPLAANTQATYDEPAFEASLREAVAGLEGAGLESGELAALDAFDAALEHGADMHEALSAAISAAEAAGGPDWARPREDPTDVPLRPAGTSLSDSADRDLPEATADGAPLFANRDGGDAERGRSFNVLLSARSPVNPAGPVQDAGFGFGFGFDAPTNFDFDRRLSIERGERNDPVTAASAAAIATLGGSAGDDLLAGTGAAEQIGGRAGADFLYGDTPDNLDTDLHTAASPLTNPTFSGTGSADTISGGAGADSIWGGPGNDRIHGDTPDASSSLYQEFGFDLGSAGYGDDAIWGGAGDDTIEGGDGNDQLYGEAGTDSLIGGAGNDTLSGGDGNDTVEGGSGIDSLYGNAGADNLFGYADDDVIIGGTGADTLSGGTGADEYRFEGGTGATTADKINSLSTDTIEDYASADGDTFGLSDNDFGLGNSGNLTDGNNYFEQASFTLGTTAVDVSSGVANAGIVILGQNTGADGVTVYYTQDASAMSNANSYQIADVIGVNMSDVEAADFFLRS